MNLFCLQNILSEKICLHSISNLLLVHRAVSRFYSGIPFDNLIYRTLLEVAVSANLLLYFETYVIFFSRRGDGVKRGRGVAGGSG